MGDSVKRIAGPALAGGVSGFVASGGNPYGAAAGAGLGALGALNKSGSATQTSTTETKRKATPVRVKLPSGATVTMYAYGPESSTTTTKGTADPGSNPLGTAGDVMGAVGLAKKYWNMSGGGSRGGGAATGGAGSPFAGLPDPDALDLFYTA